MVVLPGTAALLASTAAARARGEPANVGMPAPSLPGW
jgi:hypothetical protein